MSSVDINYKGFKIAGLDESGIKTLLTEGKYCEDDIEVVYTKPTPSLQTKSVTYTPTESAQSNSITADSGYEGLSSVSIDVDAVPSDYVGSDVPRYAGLIRKPASSTLTITAGRYLEGDIKILGVTKSNLTAANIRRGVNVKVGCADDPTCISNIVGTFGNIVSGTFKGSASGAMDVNLSYSGNGYPICVIIYPKSGPYASGTEFYTMVRQYAVIYFVAIKCVMSTTPTYANSGLENQYSTSVRYKSSATSATSYGGSSANNTLVANGADATVPSGTASAGNIVKFKSKNEMSVYITSFSDTTIGFLLGRDYNYDVIYSA